MFSCYILNNNNMLRYVMLLHSKIYLLHAKCAYNNMINMYCNMTNCIIYYCMLTYLTIIIIIIHVK